MINSGVIEKPVRSETNKFQASPVLTITGGHAIHDGYQGFLPPLLPLLIEKLSLSKTQAGLLSSFTLWPSLVQPFLGFIADRKDMRWAVILAPAVTGTVMSMIGIAPSYSFLAVLLLIVGFSTAFFHAVAPVITGAFSGAKLGLGMSLWMVGGELGRTLAPIVAVAAVGYLTLAGLPVVMVAGLLASIIIYFRLRTVTYEPANGGQAVNIARVFRQMQPVLTPVMFLLFARSFISQGMPLYLPTFLTEQGSDLWFAGASLSIMQAAGVAGALLGGSISDFLGRRAVMVVSTVAASVLFFLFISSSGWVRLPVLLLLGFTNLSVNPVIQAVVQENFPENRALANGMYMFFNFGVNAISVVLMGIIGDRLGLQWAFYLSAGVLLLGLPFIFLLPHDGKRSSAP